MRLQIAVGATDVADVDGEKDVAIVVGPMQVVFYGLIVGKAAGLNFAFRVRERLRRNVQIDYVDFVVVEFFLALVNRVGHERQLAAIGRSQQLFNTPLRLRDWTGSLGYI